MKRLESYGYRQWLLTMVVCVATGIIPFEIAALTVSWGGGGDGTNWHDQDNWVPSGIPGNGMEVTINAGATVLLTNETAELASLTMTGGTLTLRNWTTRLRAEQVHLQGATLTLPEAFTNNAMSNRIWIVCTDFTLNADAKLDAAGRGYKGTAAGTGHGPGAGTGGDRGSGAGHGGQGGTSSSGNPGGIRYGVTNAPITPGSGGGCRAGGGGPGGDGGGVIQIKAAGQVTINGIVDAGGRNAGSFDAGGGSGGSIYITAASFTGTNGSILANGGNSPNQALGGGGGGGRIALHYDTIVGVPSVNFSAKGGLGRYRGVPGEHGTLFFSCSDLLSAKPRTMAGLIVLPDLTWSIDSLTLSNSVMGFIDGFRVTVSNDVVLTGAESELIIGGHRQASTWFHCGGNMILTNQAKITVFSGPTNGLMESYGALLSVTGQLHLASGSWIMPLANTNDGGTALFEVGGLRVATNAGFDANGLGWFGTWRGRGQGIGAGTGGDRGSGAGHGSQGGISSSSTAGGIAYGLTNAPIMPGSGGGARAGGGGGSTGAAGEGGGAIRILAFVRARIDGVLKANGMHARNFDCGGGSGGSILVAGRKVETGPQAVFSVIGGDSPYTAGGQGGAGAGGRVAIWEDVHLIDQAALIAGSNVPRLRISEEPFVNFQGTTLITGGTGHEPGQSGTLRFIHGPPRGTMFMFE